MSDIPEGVPPVHRGLDDVGEPTSIEEINARMAEMQARADALASRLVGLSEAEAESLAATEDCSMRVARRDEQTFMLTMDYDPSRITATVSNSRVVTAEARG
jgi:hypothetical protein